MRRSVSDNKGAPEGPGSAAAAAPTFWRGPVLWLVLSGFVLVAAITIGTMVVVEDGHRAIGKRVEATVTSIHQTSNGRMIFAKARPERAPIS